MRKLESSAPYLRVLASFLGVALLSLLVLTLSEGGSLEFLLLRTVSRFLHFLPLSLLTGLIFLQFFFLKGLHPNWSNFFLPVLALTILQMVSALLLEPLVNANLRDHLEKKILSERAERHLEKLEAELVDSRIERRSDVGILTVYREGLSRRAKILRQLEGVYGFLASVAGQQTRIQDRREALRLQREEVERNLTRLPYIGPEKRLSWNDFTNLTAASALVLAQELYQRRQWPESYQIATLAKMLGDTSPLSDRLRFQAREELLKLPIVDGAFFSRKRRAIDLYQSGLYETSYYLLVQMEQEQLYDEEVLTYLELARAQLTRTTLFIEDARLSLEVPLYREVFLVQRSVEVPASLEFLFTEWISASPHGYLLSRPRILRRFPDGRNQWFEAEMALYRPSSPDTGGPLLDFRFKHETLDQFQRRSDGFDFATLRLSAPLETALTESLVEFSPEHQSLPWLWNAAQEPESPYRGLAAGELTLRLLSGPLFLLSVLVSSAFALSFVQKRNYRVSEQAATVLILVLGLIPLFEGLLWASRIGCLVLVGSLGPLVGLTLAGTILALLIAVAVHRVLNVAS